MDTYVEDCQTPLDGRISLHGFDSFSSTLPDDHIPPVYYADDVYKLDELVERIDAAETARDWSFILKDHIQFGNKKLDDSIGIFNIGSATDCVNLGTKHCQVDDGDCYAQRDEGLYPHTLDYRRRQEYIWDMIDVETFVDAFLQLVERKRKPVRFLRFNESGDFRHQSDVLRMNHIAEKVADHDIVAYTYTASDFLDFSGERHFVLNASNPWVEDADQSFIVVEDEDEVPEDGFLCQYSENEIQCGDCLACLHDGGEGDVYEILRQT